jgi:hypothetical protein
VHLRYHHAKDYRAQAARPKQRRLTPRGYLQLPIGWGRRENRSTAMPVSPLLQAS